MVPCENVEKPAGPFAKDIALGYGRLVDNYAVCAAKQKSLTDWIERGR